MTIIPLVILVWASLLFTIPVQSNYSSGGSIADTFPPANSTLEERESFLRSLLPPNADKGGSDGCTSRVDSTANTLNELVLIGILIPVWGEVASTNLAHFMDGKGGVKYIDYEWLRSFKEVKAIEDSLQKDVNDQAQSIAPTLADGETKVFNLKPTSPMIYFPGGFYTTELYWASGSSTIKVTGTLELYRDGDTVHASADLFLDWRDDYDWHLGASVWIPGFGRMYDHDIKMLEFCKGAKPFVLLSSWKLTWATSIKVSEQPDQQPPVQQPAAQGVSFTNIDKSAHTITVGGYDSGIVMPGHTVCAITGDDDPPVPSTRRDICGRFGNEGERAYYLH